MLTWTSRLLVAAGLGALSWCAFVIVDARVYQQSARRAFDTMPQGITRPKADAASAGLLRSIASTAAVGMPLGALSIPRLQVSVVVLHGTDALTLRRGLGHVEGTAWPGDAGNVGIAGHRDSFFRPLREIAVGDEVILDTPQGRLRYTVTSAEVVPPQEVGVLAPTDAPTLTLVTCYPFGFLGPAPDRFVVRARASGAPTKASPPIEHTSLSVDSAVTLIGALAAPDRTAANGPSRAAPDDRREEGRTAGRASDDATRIQAAIARFVWIYNARPDGEGAPGPLSLAPCDVIVDGLDAAVSSLEAPGATAGAPPIWLFSLSRSSGEWLMTSVTRP